MYPFSIQIYGPAAINSFNLPIFIGITIFIYLLLKNKTRQKLISNADFLNFISEAGIFGIIGGRLMYLLTEPNAYENFWDIFKLWQGSSSLGVIIAIGLYLFYSRKNLLALLDICCLYAPIINIFVRIGCFLTGCCFGTATDKWLGITYTNPNCLAPLNIKLHPSQLYSAIVYLIIFIIFYWMYKNNKLKLGQVTMLYFMFYCVERFILDFFRGDRAFVYNFISYYQIILILTFSVFLGGFLYFSRRRHDPI